MATSEGYRCDRIAFMSMAMALVQEFSKDLVLITQMTGNPDPLIYNTVTVQTDIGTRQFMVAVSMVDPEEDLEPETLEDMEPLGRA